MQDRETAHRLPLEFALSQLRHGYQQLHEHRVSRRGMREFADGIIAPAIRRMEQALASPLSAPPQEPTGASPQAETSANVRAVTVHICDDCLHLRGEMCHEPNCRFCRRTMVEVADYLDVLLIRPRIDGVSVLIDEGSHLPSPVSPVEPTTCPKCRSNTRAYRLAVADVIDGRMAGMTSCRDEWHSRMPMVSPVEPEPPVGSAAWLQSAGGSRMLGTASSKAVEPEPCVWRLSANGNYADAGCRPQEFFEAESVREWVACPYCGAPLKVER